MSLIATNATEATVVADNYEYDLPPAHLLNDYVEMVFLGLVVIIGLPLNIYVLGKLIAEKKRTAKDCVKGCFILLKIHLNISDVLILLTQALGKFTWIATYQWIFGDLLCRFFNFSNMFSLYLSSNIIICIAFDRLRNVLFANKLRRGKHTVRTMRIVITIAYALAAMWSLPQLYVWTTIEVYPSYPGGWVQCTDMWTVDRFLHGENITKLRRGLLSEAMQNIYNISHLSLVFFGPVALLALSYAIILAKLFHYSYKMPQKFQPKQTFTVNNVPPSSAVREGEKEAQRTTETQFISSQVCDRPLPPQKAPKIETDAYSSSVTCEVISLHSNELHAVLEPEPRRKLLQFRVNLTNSLCPKRRRESADVETQSRNIASGRPLLKREPNCEAAKIPRISVASDSGDKLKKLKKGESNEILSGTS